MNEKKMIEKVLNGYKGFYRFADDARFSEAVREKAKSMSGISSASAAGTDEAKEAARTNRFRLLTYAGYIAGGAAAVILLVSGISFVARFGGLKEGAGKLTTAETYNVSPASASVPDAPETTLPAQLGSDGMTEAEKLAAKLLNGLRWRMNADEIQLVAQDIWGRTDKYGTYEIPAGDFVSEAYDVLYYNDVDFYGDKAKLDLVVLENAGLKSVQYEIACSSDDEGTKKADELYGRIRAELESVLGELSENEDASWIFIDQKLDFFLRKTDDMKVMLYVEDMSDMYSEITDTSMPEPYDTGDAHTENASFRSLWDIRFTARKDILPPDKQEKYSEWENKVFATATPYSLSNSHNIIGCMRGLGMEWADMKELLAGVLSDEDIRVIDDAMKNNDPQSYRTLYERFKSPYAVIGDMSSSHGAMLFSPLWLYYHTLDEYRIMGVPVDAVKEIMPRYAELGLRDEAYERFRDKLAQYVGTERLPDISEAYGKMIELPDGRVWLSDVGYSEFRLTARYCVLSAGEGFTHQLMLALHDEVVTAGQECKFIPTPELDSHDYEVEYSCMTDLKPGRTYTVGIMYIDSDGSWKECEQLYSYTVPVVSAETAPPDSGDVPGTTAEKAVPPETSESTVETTVPAEKLPSDDELKALVEQGADACGLKVTVSDLTRGSLKLHYTRDKSVKNSDKLAYGISNTYEIQVRNSAGEWETYDPETLESWNDGTHWFDSLLGLGGEYKHDEEDELVLFYGNNMNETEIPDGHYRVVKIMGVRSEVTGSSLGQIKACAEFDIDSLIPNLFGIAYSLEKITPDGAELVVWQDGNARFYQKFSLGYTTPFGLQVKDASGNWKACGNWETGGIPSWDDKISPLTENGVTRIPISWKSIYGSLPDGTYRVSKEFVNYVVNSQGEKTIVNSSTYYYEFDIGEKKLDWGIELICDKVTAEGMTLRIRQRGGSFTGTLEYGEEYRIERKTGAGKDDYEPVGYLKDGAVWNDIAYIIEPGKDRTVELDWRWLYGTLPAGDYRLAKEFDDRRAPGDRDVQTLYCRFSVTDDMASKLGLTLRTSSFTSMGMTLEIVQNGGVAEGNISLGNGFIIDRLVNGKWEEYYRPEAGIPHTDLGIKVPRNEVSKWPIDWSKAVGSLPAGDYRFGEEFSCQSEEQGLIKETRYCEFTIAPGKTNAFGLQITAAEISRTGGKFGIESIGGSKEGRATYTNGFWLQKQTSGGKWKAVEPAHEDGDTGVRTSHIGLHTGAGYIGQLEEVDWAYGYGALKNGHYRLVKIFREDVDGDAEQIEVYCEFDITDDTPEKLTKL